MYCYRCETSAVHRSGYANGKQRYYCKACDYHFTERIPQQPNPHKAAIVKLYCGGISFRQAARLEGISHTTARRWVKTFAEQLPEPESKTPVSVVELDEQWHFLQKKAKALDLESSRL
jgi:transposase